MKKIIISCILIVVLLLSLVGCSNVTVETEAQQNENSSETTSMFVVVETTGIWKVVYHKETRVMYAVSYGGYNSGTFTLLVDSDGKPMTWGK